MHLIKVDHSPTYFHIIFSQLQYRKHYESCSATQKETVKRQKGFRIVGEVGFLQEVLRKFVPKNDKLLYKPCQEEPKMVSSPEQVYEV